MRYIVVKGIAGIGNRLFTLSCAIDYAIKHNRVLVVHWNDFCYSDDEKDVFNKYFQIKCKHSPTIPSEIKSICPPFWKDYIHKPTYEVCHFLRWKIGDNVGANASIDLSKDYKESVVVYFAYSPQPYSDLLKNHIAIKPFIWNIAKKIIESNNVSVGLHVRYTDNKISFDKAIKIIKFSKIKTVFLATDNQECVDELQKIVKVIQHPKSYINNDGKSLHHGTRSKKIPRELVLKDALIDICCLALCKTLIVSNKSTFSFISRLYNENTKLLFY